MIKLLAYSKILMGLFLAIVSASGAFAVEKEESATESAKGGTAKKTEASKAQSGDKVEPYGLEEGKLVDVPADLADKLGNKINALLGNEEDK
jgi:hypothetical protein